jgi:hypothetical protein
MKAAPLGVNASLPYSCGCAQHDAARLAALLLHLIIGQSEMVNLSKAIQVALNLEASMPPLPGKDLLSLSTPQMHINGCLQRLGNSYTHVHAGGS